MADLAKSILSDKQLELNAKKAKAIIEGYQVWMRDAQAFIKSTGNEPCDPLQFCSNVLIAYASQQLENKIITLS